jgi:RNA polymerase sigma-70 factor (ECF subfamily)
LSNTSVDDAELARRIGCNDADVFESLMRRNNSSLFRVARAILKDDADAEDASRKPISPRIATLPTFAPTQSSRRG